MLPFIGCVECTTCVMHRVVTSDLVVPCFVSRSVIQLFCAEVAEWIETLFGQRLLVIQGTLY